jgi:hypothetical protein
VLEGLPQPHGFGGAVREVPPVRKSRAMAAGNREPKFSAPTPVRLLASAPVGRRLSVAWCRRDHAL